MVIKMDNTLFNMSHKSITLNDIIATAIRHWQKLLCLVLTCFVVSGLYAAFIATPLYNSNAKLYIINKTANEITSSDLSISPYIAKDIVELLEDDVILSEVAQKIDKKYSNSQIRSFLNIEAAEATRIIGITVKSPNPKDSKAIADAVCDIAESELPEIMGLDRVKIVRYGNLAKRPSSPNVVSACFTGILVGLVFALSIVIIIMLTNNKFSSSEDVENILGITVLTTIPYTQNRLKK